MPETTTGAACCCLPAEGHKLARRSLACPHHGCTCGTGRRSSIEYRGVVDGSCPTHGTAFTAPTEQPTGPRIQPLDPTTLAEVDLAILANEKLTWKYQGAKEHECARIMGGRHAGPGTGPTVTGYFQRLNQLLDHPAAAAAEPTLIARLRAQREDRSA